MKLLFVHACDYALFDENSKLGMVGIFDRTFTPGFPTTLPRFAIVTGISGSRGEHTHMVEIYRPNGELLVASNLLNVPIDNTSANVISNFLIITVPEAGRHTVKIKVDGTYLTPEAYIDFEQLPANSS